MLPTLSLGDYELDVSPYEDTVTRKPWKMNLSKLRMLKPGVEGKLGLRCVCWEVGMGWQLNLEGAVAGGEHKLEERKWGWGREC